MQTSLDLRGGVAPSSAREGLAPSSAREGLAPAFDGAGAASPGACDAAPPGATFVAKAPEGDAPATLFSIREVAAATGVTAHTLRYYERAGLLPRVPRASSGHRRYGPTEVRWVTFLRRLHETGMPIRRMLEYARLVRRGESTAAERRALLVAHRDEVAARMRVLAENMALIEKKIASYEALEQRRREAAAEERS